MSKEKLHISNKERQLINVERLLAQVGLLSNELNKINFNWYPKELHEPIMKYLSTDTNNFMSALLHWIEENTSADYFD